MAKPFLEWIGENQKANHLEIIDKVFIGRSCKGVDPRKRILVHNELVSRDHAVVSRIGDHLKVTDMSKNGTWVNRIRLAAGASSDLVDGDVISVGGVSLRVYCPEDVTEINDGTSSFEGTMVTPVEIVVTNVVADVRGFTTLSQAHASTDVYALMKEIFNTFSAIVYKFKGTIKDYAGDAVYAFWDHDAEATSAQAVLACQAAIQQAQTVKDIQAKLSAINITVDNLQMGWGITTGSVTMSHYGSRAVDLALVGDCTNLAFRLAGMANNELSERLVVCSRTADLVRNDIELKDLGEVPIKGRKGREHVLALKQPH